MAVGEAHVVALAHSAADRWEALRLAAEAGGLEAVCSPTLRYAVCFRASVTESPTCSNAGHFAPHFLAAAVVEAMASVAVADGAAVWVQLARPARLARPEAALVLGPRPHTARWQARVAPEASLQRWTVGQRHRLHQSQSVDGMPVLWQQRPNLESRLPPMSVRLR